MVLQACFVVELVEYQASFKGELSLFVLRERRG